MAAVLVQFCTPGTLDREVEQKSVSVSPLFVYIFNITKAEN